jgi:hypothetical protein
MVCFATWEDKGFSVCPQCSYDAQRDGANEPHAILAARESFKHKTTAYAPDSRVSRFDKLKPWLALGVGMLIFLFWLRACATGGRLFF